MENCYGNYDAVAIRNDTPVVLTAPACQASFYKFKQGFNINSDCYVKLLQTA